MRMRMCAIMCVRAFTRVCRCVRAFRRAGRGGAAWAQYSTQTVCIRRTPFHTIPIQQFELAPLTIAWEREDINLNDTQSPPSSFLFLYQDPQLAVNIRTILEQALPLLHTGYTGTWRANAGFLCALINMPHCAECMCVVFTCGSDRVDASVAPSCSPSVRAAANTCPSLNAPLTFFRCKPRVHMDDPTIHLRYLRRSRRPIEDQTLSCLSPPSELCGGVSRPWCVRWRRLECTDIEVFGGSAEQAEERRCVHMPCLLYTSPSPRD